MPKKGTKIVADKKCIDFKARALERLKKLSSTNGWTYCETVERGLFALPLAQEFPKSDIHGLLLGAVNRIAKRLDSERRGGSRESGRAIQGNTNVRGSPAVD